MYFPYTRSECYLFSVLVGSLSVVVVMYMCVGTEYRDIVPSGANVSEWRQFRDKFKLTVSGEGTARTVVFLMVLHLAHILLCLPMMHVTKVLYGFLLGPLSGGALCSAWETFVVLAYVCSLHISRNQGITALVESSRARHILFYELACVQIASLPLHVAATLVSFGGVSVWEFMSSHTVVTCLMSFKDTLAGGILSGDPSPRTVVYIGVLLVVSTVLPTAMTMYLSVRGFVEIVKTMHRDKLHAEETGGEYELSVQEDGQGQTDAQKRNDTRVESEILSGDNSAGRVY